MATMDWGSVTTELEKFKTESKTRNKNEPFGFWLAPGSEAEIVLLRDDLHLRMEHTLFKKNSDLGTKNILCLRNEDEDADCPLCKAYARNRNGPVGPQTLVAYIDVMVLGEVASKKSDKVYKNQVRAARLKSSTIETLIKIRKKAGTLEGLEISVSRPDDSKSPSVGSTWLPGNKLTPEEIKKLNPEVKLHNWDEDLPTWTYREIKEQVEIYTGFNPDARAEPEAQQKPNRKW